MGIGSSLKKAIKKIVPKELGDVAQVAAFIPGPHQAVTIPLAIGTSLLDLLWK